MDILSKDAAAGQAVECKQIISIDRIVYQGRGSIQARAEVNHFVVNEYAELRKDGTKFDPVHVFDVGGKFYLADGRHRIESAVANGEKQIECIVHEGDLSAARAYAAGANAEHGLRRTNADKVASVKLLLTDETWRTRSDNLIAIQCGVSQNLVVKVRAELSSHESSTPKVEPPKRIGRDGKRRPSTYRPRKPKPAEPAPQPAPKANESTAANLPQVADAVLNGRLPLAEAMRLIGEAEPTVNDPEAVAVVAKASPKRTTETVVEVDHGEDRQDDARADHEPGVEFNLSDELVSLITRADNEIKAWPLDVQDAKRVADSLRRLAGRVEERAAQDADGRAG